MSATFHSSQTPATPSAKPNRGDQPASRARCVSTITAGISPGLAGPCFDGNLRAGDAPDLVDHLENRKRPARSDHHRTGPARVAQRQLARGNHVADVHVIAHLASVTVDLERSRRA